MNIIDYSLIKMSLIGIFLGSTLLGEISFFRIKLKNKTSYKFIEILLYIMIVSYVITFTYFNLYKDRFQNCIYILILFGILEVAVLIKYKLWKYIMFFIFRVCIYFSIILFILFI